MIAFGKKAQEPGNGFALCRGSSRSGHHPGVPIDERGLFTPETREGNDRVSVVQRSSRSACLFLVGTDHPGPGRKDASFAVHESSGRGREVLVARGQTFGVQIAVQGNNLARLGIVEPNVAFVREDDSILCKQVGVKVRYEVVGGVDLRLDQVRFSGGFAELPSVGQKLFGRTGKDRFVSGHQPGFAHQTCVDVP